MFSGYAYLCKVKWKNASGDEKPYGNKEKISSKICLEYQEIGVVINYFFSLMDKLNV